MSAVFSAQQTAPSNAHDVSKAGQQYNALNQRLSPLRLKIYNALMMRIDPSAAIQMTREELYRETEEFVSSFVSAQGLQVNKREQGQIATDIVYDMVGFGPLEMLLMDEDVTDIMVNGPDMIFVERKGKLERSWIQFRDEDHILQISQRIAGKVGRRVDESSPMVDARLPDGSRVNIIIPPVSLNGPVISIRKFSKKVVDIGMMVAQGNLSQEIADFLKIAMTCRLNVLVSGGTGSGKTTLLNAMSLLIDHGERILTIEDAAELKLQHPHLVRLETRPANTEGAGSVDIRILVKNALRMRPDRIVVGEVRGEETIDMLQAMNTGHDGSMSTIHANKAVEALLRLENMITLAEASIPSKVIRAQISGGVDLIVQVDRMRDGKRRVREIIEVLDMEGEEIGCQTLFSFDIEGNEKEGGVSGRYRAHPVVPNFLDKARYYGLEPRLVALFKDAR